MRLVIAPTLKWSRSRMVTKIKITNTNETPWLAPVLFQSPPSTTPEESEGLQVWWNPWGTFKEFEVLFESLFADSKKWIKLPLQHKEMPGLSRGKTPETYSATRSKIMKRVQNAGPSLQPTLYTLSLRVPTLIVMDRSKEVMCLIMSFLLKGKWVYLRTIICIIHSFFQKHNRKLSSLFYYSS